MRGARLFVNDTDFLEVVDGTVYYDGSYYPGWSVCTSDALAGDYRPQAPFEAAKARRS